MCPIEPRPPTDAYVHSDPNLDASALVANPCAPIAQTTRGTSPKSSANTFATSPRFRGMNATFATSPLLASSRSFALRFFTGPSNLWSDLTTFAPALCASATSFSSPKPSSKST